MSPSSSTVESAMQSRFRATFEAHYQHTRRLSAPPVWTGTEYQGADVQLAWVDWCGGAGQAESMSDAILADANRYQIIKKLAFNRTMAGFDGPVLQWTLTVPADENEEGLDAAVLALVQYHGERPYYGKPVRGATGMCQLGVRVGAGLAQFEEVGRVYHERVNDEYEGILDEDRVVAGEKLYRQVPLKCAECQSEGFPASVSGHGCSFCDGTEGGCGPESAH